MNTGCRYLVTSTSWAYSPNTRFRLGGSPLPVAGATYSSSVRLRYRYRLDPTPAQRQALARAFGCARVVYNDGLRLRQDAYRTGQPFISDTELQHRVLTLAKRTPQRVWLSEVSAVILQQSLADLSRAYGNYFADLKRVKVAKARGKKAKLKVRKPRYKSRNHHQAIRFTANARFRLLPNGRLRLPKIRDLKVRWSRALPSDPSSVTVTLDAAGRYHASFVLEVAEAPLPASDSAVGVDPLQLVRAVPDRLVVRGAQLSRVAGAQAALVQGMHPVVVGAVLRASPADQPVLLQRLLGPTAGHQVVVGSELLVVRLGQDDPAHARGRVVPGGQRRDHRPVRVGFEHPRVAAPR